ncbi:probable sodium/potassium/calcium exchanger CG1090 isoform X2 [Artemia franciscana]
MFVSLSIICDDYFVPSLERISESLQIQQDVAGATFMAAGSSAPELATSIIGVFVAQDDIGISGVIGSAVFNVMFVIGSCALFSGSVIYITWWPLTRDCLCYLISIIALLFTIIDEEVTWYEAMVLLTLYCLYIVLMYFNPRIEARLGQFNIPVPETARKIGSIEHERLIPYRSLDEEVGIPTERHLPHEQEGCHRPCVVSVSEEKKAEEENILHSKPWYTYTVMPIQILCKYSIPDCKEEKATKYYIIAFFVSLVWISLFSYIMVWMITIIGFTLGIPDTVMGLTFVAAGASIPDILSSLAVARDGFGDMAVANAIGSNVFDILVCLGLPWFLQTVIAKPGSVVRIISKGMVYSTVSLFSTIIFLVVATHLNKWKLDKKYGCALILWYLFFICVASMYELNIFGEFNPPECHSSV